MTDRLNSGPKTRIAAPKDKKERERFWIERGNRILWGQEPTAKYGYLESRHDLEWVCRNGNYSIVPRHCRSDAQVDRSPEGGDHEDGRHSRERGREAMRP